MITRKEGKKKKLEDFYKGQSLAHKVFIVFQDITLHEFVNGLCLLSYDVKDMHAEKEQEKW